MTRLRSLAVALGDLRSVRICWGGPEGEGGSGLQINLGCKQLCGRSVLHGAGYMLLKQLLPGWMQVARGGEVGTAG